ncbi:ribosome maturation protein [Panaeolus papilionaceus]|nr:ribosome maturation protein [Panaeolus papilionaceus]
MTRTVTKVIYKPDNQSTHEYSVIVDPVEFKKWKAGDTTIPLVNVVESFQIYHSTQGSQGLQHTPSKQQLDTDFGSHKDTEVVEIILKNGKDQPADAPIGYSSNKNISIGSAANDATRRAGFN